MKRNALALVLILLLIGGCGESQVMPFISAEDNTGAEISKGVTAGADESFAAEDAVQKPKIIRTAEVDIRSTGLDADVERINSRVASLGGYVANSRTDRSGGAGGFASLSVKVPAERFDVFIGFLEKEFKIERLNTDSRDITEKYLDLDARLNNARRGEKRMLEILDNKTGDLKDVLAVERELSRVRERIELVQGKLRFYDARLALSTIECRLRREKPILALGESWHVEFGRDIKSTFLVSINVMGRLARAIVIFMAAIFPWAMVSAMLVYFIFRIRRRAKSAGAA